MTQQKTPATQTHHGITLHDAYDWLRADNWQDVLRDPTVLPEDIRTFLEKENAETKAFLAPTQELQDDIYAEIRGRMKEDDAGVPQVYGDYTYSWHFEKGSEYRIWTRTSLADGDTQIILDENKLAKNCDYFHLGGFEMSPDHSKIAYMADVQGSEFYTLFVKDVATGKFLADPIEGLSSSLAWANDGQTLFFLKLNENHRPDWVQRRTLDDKGWKTPAQNVYQEEDPTLFVGVGKTEDDAYITLDIHDHTMGEVWVIDANKPESTPQLIRKREADVEYTISHQDGTFYIHTNLNEAKDYCVMQAKLGEDWKPLIEHVAGQLIESMYMIQDYILLHVREDALPQIQVYHIPTGDINTLGFDAEAYDLSPVPLHAFNTTTLRFSYSDPTQPTQIWDFDLATEACELRKEQEIPSGFDGSQYTVKRLHATAKDGEHVPMTVIYHKDTPLDGSAPTLLYGYGSYGIVIDAAFRGSLFSLIDRGLIYAFAHIRGGKDKGQHWYENGKLAHKENTFTDFISCAEHLISENYTSQGKIIAQGGSAGGMLMGAIANMRPELWGGIIGQVPFVDVLHTILDASLPLTPPEWREWGNPIEDKTAFETIQRYSPIDNIQAQAYPPIYALGGLSDPRVTYWEPAKWIAKLKDTRTNNAPCLLDINMTAGHGGSSGRFEYIKEIAKVYAFAIMMDKEKEV